MSVTGWLTATGRRLTINGGIQTFCIDLPGTVFQRAAQTSAEDQLQRIHDLIDLFTSSPLFAEIPVLEVTFVGCPNPVGAFDGNVSWFAAQVQIPGGVTSVMIEGLSEEKMAAW